MPSTTIELDSQVRDALDAEVRRRGLTAGGLVEELLAAALRERGLAALRQAIAATPAAERAAYDAETDAF